LGDEVAGALHAFWIEVVRDHFEDGDGLAVESSGAYKCRSLHVGKTFVGSSGWTGVGGTALVWQCIQWWQMVDLMGVGVDDLADVVEAADILSCG